MSKSINYRTCSKNVLLGAILNLYSYLVVEHSKRSLSKDQIIIYRTIRRFYLGVVSEESVRNALALVYGNPD